MITTQPADRARGLMEQLQLKGARAMNMPLIKTRTQLLPEASFGNLFMNYRPDLLVFTSSKGVRGFFENLAHATGSYSLPYPVAIAVVGPATASEVENYSSKVTYINPGNDALALAGFLKKEVLKPEDKVLLALGNLAPGFLEEDLCDAAQVRRINVYETILLKPEDTEPARLIRQGKADMVVFTSPSAFSSFLNHFAGCPSVPMAAIGSTTAAAIREAGHEVAVTSSSPTAEQLANAVKNFFKGH